MAICIAIALFPANSFCQTGEPEKVQEVVLDSLTFTNGDTTVVANDVTDNYENHVENTDSVVEDIIFRSVPDTTVDRFKKDKDFEYANDPRYWIKKKEKEKSDDGSWLDWLFLNSGVRVFMYLLLAAVMIFVVYRLIITNNLFYSKSKKIKETESINETEISDDNIDQKIESAISVQNFRMATRYLYIKTLRKLDSRGLIQYHPQATNYDYINQLTQHKVAEDFGFVTRIYEYVWYGEFEMNEQQFQSTRAVIEKIHKDAK